MRLFNNMKKIRIIKRSYPSGMIKYVIQVKHFLFRWWWVDAGITSWDVYCTDNFDTLKEAEYYLYMFDGSKSKEEIIKQIN